MQTNGSKICLYSTKDKYFFTAWFGVYLLYLPLFLYVLYVGYKRHRNQRSASVSSHSDVITFHMVALELCSMGFSCLYMSGIYSGPSSWARIGGSAVSLCLVGQALFHCLTCVERYLAVVHPITYLHLKKKGGVTIRNISIGCVWLLSLGNTCLKNVENIDSVYKITSTFVVTVFSVTVTGFCSVSVVCVLIRPGPGERGGNKRILTQSKRFALETVVAILSVLLLRILAFLMRNISYMMTATDPHRCPIGGAWLWLNLPSSLVLPLLFLHRAGKLKWLKKRKPIAHLPSNGKVQGLNTKAGPAQCQ